MNNFINSLMSYDARISRKIIELLYEYIKCLLAFTKCLTNDLFYKKNICISIFLKSSLMNKIALKILLRNKSIRLTNNKINRRY